MDQSRIVATLARLVAFDTTSRASNLPLIAYVEEELDRHDIPSRRISNAEGTKANLWASIGPQDEAGFVLSGHTDTVPVDGQNWSSDPFELVQREGRLYGRGTCDMKGFIAVCLALAPEIKAAGLKRPIHLAFSYDEEVGCTGVVDMVREVGAMPVRPLACFVGEPTSMGVVVGHKGSLRHRIGVRGRAAHSSLAPSGVNAVEWGARLVAFARDVADRIAAEGPRDELQDVQHTTVHVGRFEGGTAWNIVPHEASFFLEVRAIHGEDPAAIIAEVEDYAVRELQPRMRAVAPEAGFTFEHVNEVPVFEVGPEEPVVTLAKRLAGRNDHAKVAYGTEAGHFVRTGHVPSVVIGPGSIEQAHKPDEFVEIAQLEACAGFVRRLVEQARAG